MKQVEVRVPHALDPLEVKRRIDAGMVRAKSEFADSLGDVEATWQDDRRLELTLAVMGVSIDGEVEVLAEEVVVRVELPAMAMLFAGRIRQGLETRLGGLLGSSQG